MERIKATKTNVEIGVRGACDTGHQCRCSFSKESWVEHNQCDICLKKFDTALGFHQHYPRCVRNNL